MQTVISGQQTGRLIFFIEDFMDVHFVVYASFDRWLLAGRDTNNLPKSCVKSTDISPRDEYGYPLDDPAEFRRRCIKWLLRKAKSDHPPVAVLATGANRDE